MSMNPFGSKAIPEDDEEYMRDGASTPETVSTEPLHFLYAHTNLS
jgi:hypothetical protein